MDALREFLTRDSALALAIGGLVLGFLFGAIVFRTNYCAMGSLSDILNFGDWRRFRAWVLAAATALIGAQLLQAAGAVSLEKSMYMAPALGWVGHIAGGLIFGFGMVFAGGCPSRNLARAGGGDLRALMTLIVLGLFAYMTIGGIVAPGARPSSGPPRWDWPRRRRAWATCSAAATGLGVSAGNLLITAVLAGLALVYCFGNARFRASPVHILSGIGVGLVVVGGWALTGLAYDDFAARPTAPISLTYVRPAGDALEWLQRFTASPVPGFGTASRVRRPARGLRRGAGDGALPCVDLLRFERHAAQFPGRRPDGHRRGDGARLHGRAGDHRRVDAGARLVPHLRGDRRGRIVGLRALERIITGA